MLVPLFNLVTHRPDLIVDHLAGDCAADHLLFHLSELILCEL